MSDDDFLKQYDDKVFSYIELNNDPMSSYIEKEKVADYLSFSMDYGKKRADTYNISMIMDELKKNNVPINMKSCTGFNQIRSQIYYSKKEQYIDVFKDSLLGLQCLLDGSDFFMSLKELNILHIAHEFYHYLEYSSGIFVNDMCKSVNYKFLGVFPQKATIMRTREIAAHMFAKNLCGLTFHPMALDFYVLMQENNASREWCFQQLEAAKEFVKEYCYE